jgi:predicted nuclease of predicted toxin-antitoxin system
VNRPGLLADENIAAPIVAALREHEWDIFYIMENCPGATDDEVLALVRSEHRIVIREDKDFGELVFRLKRDVPGIVLLRLPEPTWEQRWPRIRDALAVRVAKLRGKYTVIEQERIRSRYIPNA